MAKALFYTGAAPVVPKSLSKMTEESYFATYKGTKIVLFTNQTEYGLFFNRSRVAISDHVGYDYSIKKYMEVSDKNGT